MTRPPKTSQLDLYIAQKFRGVGVRFHHAENLHDFAVYCREGALLARAELRRLSPSFTAFYSDPSDEERGALTRVFGNLRDFGTIMACGRGAIPNVYGPIHLVFRPDCFAMMSDLVITKTSIVSLGDSWRAEAASTAREVDHIASGRAFDDYVSRDWAYAEVSCAESRLDFALLDKVIVEPIAFAGRRLVDVVRAELHMAGIRGVKVLERDYQRPENLEAIGALAGFCEHLPAGLNEQSSDFRSASELAAFADRPPERKRRLALWARYFYFGTVSDVRARDSQFEEMLAAADAADTREPCGLCDGGHDSSPAMVKLGPFYVDGVRSRAVEAGACDYCNGTSLRCLYCGAITPVLPRHGSHQIECDGGCGTRFVATCIDTMDGPVVDVELVDAVTSVNLAEELEQILLAQHEDDFISAALEGEYPVCDVELDQLVVTLGPTPGTATAEWGFGASHHSEDGIYFGGVVTGAITFDAAAGTRAVLLETIQVDNVRADFDVDDDGEG
jgi:hypothetical protein